MTAWFAGETTQDGGVTVGKDPRQPPDGARSIAREDARFARTHTGKDIATIEKDTDRDNFMIAAEACQYGLVDVVMQSRKDPKGKPEGKADEKPAAEVKDEKPRGKGK